MPIPPGNTTGKLRYRVGWFGRLILQCEIYTWRECELPGPKTKWRDANRGDLFRLRAQKRTVSLIVVGEDS